MRERRPAERTTTGYLAVYAPAAVLTLLGFWLAYQFVDPAPPERVTIATGGSQGAYFHFAERYAEVFAREGIELEIRQTAGSAENLALLREPGNGIDIAFVQGGVGAPSAAASPLHALGSLYFEPLWVFHRLRSNVTDLRQLAGKRLGVGREGSGTRTVVLELLNRNRIDGTNTSLVPVSGEAGAAALEAGRVDAVFLVAGARSPLVQRLLRTDANRLMSFARAAAYERVLPYLSRVVLPRGAIDLARDVPSDNVTLLAPSATLIATEALHPAIIDLTLQAASQVHGRGGLFERFGQFPSPEFIDFPLSGEAKRFFDAGTPFLQRFMPFWAATLVDRLAVMLLPFVALVLPLMRVMPPVYQWRMRARVYRWYKELLAIDPVVGQPSELSVRMSELARIEDEVSKVNVPMSFADQLYQLRAHIELVRERLSADRASAGSPEGETPP